MNAWEIHCPQCGVIIRNVAYAEAKTGCPDCKSPGAIFLDYEEPLKVPSYRDMRILLP